VRRRTSFGKFAIGDIAQMLPAREVCFPISVNVARRARFASAQTTSHALTNLCCNNSRIREHRAEGKLIKEHTVSVGTILLVVLILMLVGVLPVWPHASSWGYGPTGIVGVILIVIIVLFLMGRL
jgi:membrane-bound ClpP family serine protease